MTFYATIHDDEVQEYCDSCSTRFAQDNPGTVLVAVSPLYERCCDACGEHRYGRASRELLERAVRGTHRDAAAKDAPFWSIVATLTTAELERLQLLSTLAVD